MARYSISGVAGLTSETFHPFPPIELGRAGGTVTALTVVNAGTNYATNGVGAATTSDSGATGLTVDYTASSGPTSNVVVAVGGDGYRLGDVVTIDGDSADATYKVTGLQYTN